MKAFVMLLSLGFMLASIACGGPTEPTLRLSGVSPNQGRPGENVTIFGFNLDGDPVSVTFNDVAAMVVHVSEVTIVVTVPNMAAGSVTVRVRSGSRTASLSGFSVLSAALVSAHTSEQQLTWQISGSIPG